jgi:hypothetical protein
MGTTDNLYSSVVPVRGLINLILTYPRFEKRGYFLTVPVGTKEIELNLLFNLILLVCLIYLP